MNCTICVELSENVEAEVEVLFTCTHRGRGGDYWTESEGPEFTVEAIEIVWVAGETWCKDGSELGDWYDMVSRLAEKAIDDELLYNCQLYTFWEN